MAAPGGREVMAMAAAEQEGGPVPDLYELLGVDPGASGGEITRAWRRRAAAEHPDRRPRDAAAPARFRALTNDDQALVFGRTPHRVIVRRVNGRG